MNNNKRRDNCLDILIKQYGSLDILNIDVISKNILRIIKDISYNNITKEDFEKYPNFFTNPNIFAAFKTFANSKATIVNRRLEVYKYAVSTNQVFAADDITRALYDLAYNSAKLWTFISSTYDSWDMNYEWFSQNYIQSYLGFQTRLNADFKKSFGLIDK